jgi:hypothetical protein
MIFTLSVTPESGQLCIALNIGNKAKEWIYIKLTYSLWKWIRGMELQNLYSTPNTEIYYDARSYKRQTLRFGYINQPVNTV